MVHLVEKGMLPTSGKTHEEVHRSLHFRYQFWNKKRTILVGDSYEIRQHQHSCCRGCCAQCSSSQDDCSRF